MSSPRTVPLLPCGSIDRAAEFGLAMDFEVTYRQGPPHPYLALRSVDGIELHYFQIADFDPATSHGSCLVIVADPVAVLAAWSAGLDRLYGVVPVSGIPRLMRPKARTSTDAFLGFSLIDIGGNRIRVVKDTSLQATADAPIEVVVAPTRTPPPESDPEPDHKPEPEREPDGPPRPSAFERHGVAVAPHHRLSAQVYLAELAIGLGRLDDARGHLAAAELIDASAPTVLAARESLLQAETQLD